MKENIVETNLSLNEEAQNEVVVESVKHYEDKNEAVLEGTFVSRYDLKNASLLTVLTSTGREQKSTSDVVVVVTGDLKEQTADLEKGQRIKVVGEVRTRSRDKDKNPISKCEILASSVEKAKSKLEENFGLEGRVYEPSYNQVMLTGTIARFIQVNRAVARVVVQIKKGDKTRYVETTMFARNMKRLIPQLLVGNRVCMLCELQSSKKDGVGEDGKPSYYKNVVILDMKEV